MFNVKIFKLDKLMDVKNMSEFRDRYFDTVIDKGTLDSLYVIKINLVRRKR